MKIKPVIFGLLVISIFFGIILAFQSAGFWSTSGKVDGNNNTIQPSVTDPTTIKGWMTLGQIIETYGVTLQEIQTQFDLPSTALPDTALKDLESETFETSILIAWLQTRVQSDQNVESIAATPSVDSNTLITAETAEHVQPDRTISGKTTFQDLLDWGLTEEVIKSIIDDDLPLLPTIIKDYAIEKGVEFSEIKTLLQIEVEKIK